MRAQANCNSALDNSALQFSQKSTPSCGRLLPLTNELESQISFSQQFDIKDADITALLREVVSLIEVSEYLGCVHAVSRTIDAALLGQGQILFRSIASNPTAWVDLAVRAQAWTRQEIKSG
ncbi:hypothetical protein EJ08DRAFT_703197 [Tothia fuscella]|uniref:Uncharacterized protein n=1 Tax=Tothia fuscella TaxID=1048955 RepID=A0A9P4TSR2_9PEZI|nr:hypothetical protein EJ08DRAFT_703197 [Tothia fuscella]